MERSYRTIDKSAWPRGAWDEEPDKVQWVDEATDLDCLIVRGRSGALCGYVGCPPGHPLHGLSDGYESPVSELEVHGGITYADSCQEDAPEESAICHVPLPGRADDVWWLGFDTAHSGDICPAHETGPMAGDSEYGSYKRLDYVRRRTEYLAQQIKVLN